MEKKCDQLMLDLKTLGTVSYSCVLSIGAVEFNLETGETGREFYERISLESCLDLGLTINPATLRWWMLQSKEALQELLKEEGAEHLVAVMVKFSAFVKDKDYTIWGNSPRFDVGLIQNIYNKIQIPIPWDFRKEKCVRTLVGLNPDIKKNHVFVGVPHNAIDDCKNQIAYCHETYKWTVGKRS